MATASTPQDQTQGFHQMADGLTQAIDTFEHQSGMSGHVQFRSQPFSRSSIFLVSVLAATALGAFFAYRRVRR